MGTHRQQVFACGHLAEPGDTVQVERGHCQVLVLHKPEGLEREMCLLRQPIDIHLCLSVTCTPWGRKTWVVLTAHMKYNDGLSEGVSGIYCILWLYTQLTQ